MPAFPVWFVPLCELFSPVAHCARVFSSCLIIKQQYSFPFPGDLYKLGFIPEGAPLPEDSGIVQPLSQILRQLSQGGGARAINIEEVKPLNFLFANSCTPSFEIAETPVRTNPTFSPIAGCLLS